MRKTPWLAAEPYRFQIAGIESGYGDSWGVFVIPRSGVVLRAIVANGDYKAADMPPEYAWEHVSVSLQNRCPNWPEMCFIKSVFWDDDETVIQFHVPAKDHLNVHPYCLHLWRPLNVEIPRPPSDTVGVPGSLEDNRRHLKKILSR